MSVSETRAIPTQERTSRFPKWIVLPLQWFSLPLIIVGIWSVLSVFAPNTRFPAPVKIGSAFSANWLNETFIVDVLPSLGRLGIGVVLAIVVGIGLGVLVGSIKWLREFLEPAFDFFRAIPPPMVVPVIVPLLGAGDTMKIAVIAAGAMWPILLNTIEGVRAVDQVQRETSQSFGLPRTHRLVFITLPSASPQIMAGIRQALAIALILMVISEMFLASSGIGYRIEVFKQNYDYAAMWSIILLLGLISVLIAVLFQIAERIILTWYRGLKEAERA